MTPPRTLVAAFEGPCCAGKTTLAHRLLTSLQGLKVAFVPCYADHVGGGRYLPRQEAKTVQERNEALQELLAVEAGRLAAAASGVDVILADRSVHTLLAHSYALEIMTGIGFLAPSVRLLSRSPIPAWPELVFYLDLPQEAVCARNCGKFQPTASTQTRSSTLPSGRTSCGSPARRPPASPGWMRCWNQRNLHGWPRCGCGKWWHFGIPRELYEAGATVGTCHLL